MGNVIIYRIPYQKSKPDYTTEDVVIEIQDRANFEPGEENTLTYKPDLVGAEVPLEIATVNDAYDAGKQIFAKHARIRFLSTNTVSGATFSSGEDGRFYVVVRYENDTKWVFEGYLVMDNIEDPFLPPGSVVELVATDGLGLLRKVPLTDHDGNRLQGTFSKIQLLSYCLAKTGLQKDIHVAVNLYEARNKHRGEGTSFCPYDQQFIDITTMEEAVDRAMNCYEVIEHILPPYTRLSYHNAAWVIQRLFETRSVNWYYTRYNWDAAKIGGVLWTGYRKNVGHQNTADIYFTDNSTLVTKRRPRKKVVASAAYQSPDEVPQNYHFRRGDERTDLVTGANEKFFYIADWTLKRGLASSILGVPATPTAYAYIQRNYIDSYENNRWAVVTRPASDTAVEYIENNIPVYLCQGAKVNISVDFRLNGNANDGVKDHEYYVRLVGFDGTHWTMDEDGKWYQSDVNWSTNFKNILYQWDTTLVDESSDWQTISVEGQALPVSGKLYLMLPAFITTGSYSVYYANLQVEVRALINGSYQLFTGEKIEISQDGQYSETDERELLLYDAPCRSLKGCQLINAVFGVPQAEYLKTDLWIDLSTFGLPDPYKQNKKWLEMIAWDMWHQNKKDRVIIAFSMKGLDTDNDFCDLVHVYNVLNNTQHTSNQQFILTSMVQNWKDGSWTGTLMENEAISPQYDFAGDVVHEYITENANA